MKRNSPLFFILLLLVASCGSNKEAVPVSRSEPMSAAPACAEPFRSDYRDVRLALETVKADMNAAYSKDAAASKTEAELHDARAKAYQDAMACRKKAVALRNKYEGYRCTTGSPGKPRLIEVNPLMGKLIDALDRVPAVVEFI